MTSTKTQQQQRSLLRWFPSLAFFGLGTLLLSRQTAAEVNSTIDLNPNDIFDALVAPSSGYDARTRPLNRFNESSPLVVSSSIHIYFIGHFDDQDTQFEVFLQLRHRWDDPRLAFSGTNITGADNVPWIEGEKWFSDSIWTPNIYLENEVSSEVSQLMRENVYLKIFHDGMVQMSYRVGALLLCNMDLMRFPHDIQICAVRLESCKNSFYLQRKRRSTPPPTRVVVLLLVPGGKFKRELEAKKPDTVMP